MQEYTTEFKGQAVNHVKIGESIDTVAKELDLIEQTLRNWVKAAEAGELTVAESKQDSDAGADGAIPIASRKYSADSRMKCNFEF